MNLAYIAAEYFVDAIAISRDYKVSYDYVKILRNLIGKDISPQVSEYLDKKSKHDFLYILKKFPDIFVVEEHLIGLTEPFLSLYNLNKFLISKRFHTINCYVKNCAIEYFRKILLTQGPKPYLELFNMLMTDHTQKYAKYFLHFSTADILNFFLSHPNYFTVIHKNVVFLTARNPVLPYSLANDHDDTEAMKIFEISVYFLLTCYKSMHYFHLKQCLSYVHASTKRILEQISLVRQRELFAILPAATMDASGFVSLKNREILVALPDIIKTILLLVCILAFKKELYIVDLVAEFSNRMLPAVNHFSDLTFEEQIDFMAQYPMYFHIAYTGHISLLPGFILPECPFPQPSEHESGLQTVGSNVIIGTDGNQFSDDSNAAKDVYSPNTFPVGIPGNKSCTVTSHSELLQNALPPIDLSLPGLPEIAIERIKQSFFYLSKHFYPLDKKHAMQTLLHSVDDVRISFCSSSDKCKFITECCNFINSLSEEYLETTAGSINELLTEKEKNVLFIIYILSSNEPIYFLTLVETMREHEMDNILLRSTVSDQIKYFKTLSGYIEVYSDGSIIFPTTFFPIKSIIDSYSNLFSEFECAFVERVSQDKPSSRKVLLQDPEPPVTKMKPEGKKPLMTFKNKSAKHSKALSWVADVVSQEPKSSNASEDNVSSYINVPVVIPDTVCKTLSHCAKLLSKYYECAATIHILKATLFSFTDIYDYLLSLPLMSDQYAFAEKCFEYLNKENHSYSSPLGPEEREILFITYMLLNSEEERMHYRKIVLELSACHCRRISQLKVDRSQFWYFRKAKKYFAINSDGFVTLSSSFNYINVLVNVAINRTAKSPSVLKESVHKSTKFHKINPKQPSMKNRMTVEMPAFSSSNNSSVKNRNSKKLEATESQFEMQETSAERINIDDDTRDLIIDIMFFFLPLCCKMSIEKLCIRLNSFNIKGVQNMFSSCTITEKLNFFKNLSPYFEVSKDGFVSLKKDAAKTFVPKTNVNLSELFNKNSPSSEGSSRSRSESVKSTDVSESSVKVSTASGNNVTKRRRRRRSGSKKHENTRNKISYEVHKVADKAQSPKPVKKDFHNSNIRLQSNHSESALKMLPSSSVSKENECSTAMKDINKDGEISKSTPEIQIIMEIKGTKNTGLVTETDSNMSIDQVPEFCNKKEKEGKFVECQSKSPTSPLEKAKICALSISEDILKLKVPRQPIKESMSSKLSKSSLTLLDNTPEKNKQNEMSDSSTSNLNQILLVNDSEPAVYKTLEVKSNLSNASEHNTPEKNKQNEMSDSSTNNLNQVLLVNDSEPAVLKTLEVKSNLSNASERATVSKPETENISSFKEIDEALQTCSMPLGDNFHNDLKNDSSYQAYISDLIDEFLYSAKTNPSDTETSNLNNEREVSCVSNKDSTSELTSVAVEITALKYHYSWKVPDDKKDSSSNSTSELKSETQNLPKCSKVSETVPHQSLVPILKNCDKSPDVPNNGASNKPESLAAQRDSSPVEIADFEKVIEDRAVAFFTVMLKNYQKYDESISADFLKKHISQASAEVQSFMFKHYGYDFVPFFQKHKKVFYVSPMTRCVYLVRKSSQKLRVKI